MDTRSENCISLRPSGEEETGSAGEQPVRNSLTDRNGHGGLTSPHFPLFILGIYVLKNSTENRIFVNHFQDFFENNKCNSLSIKTCQPISGRDNKTLGNDMVTN